MLFQSVESYTVVESTLYTDARLCLTTQRQIFQNVSLEIVSDLPRDSTPFSTPPHSYSIWWCRAICVVQVMSSVQKHSTSSSSIISADSQSVIVITVFVFYCCTSTIVVQCSSTFYKPVICQCLTYYLDSILCDDRLMTVVLQSSSTAVYYSGCIKYMFPSTIFSQFSSNYAFY